MTPTEEEIRITIALEQAKDTIQDLRYKLDLAIECLEDYYEHILFEQFPWAAEDAKTCLEKIR
jgi:hypothetical protein